jgi:hypothetical protein
MPTGPGPGPAPENYAEEVEARIAAGTLEPHEYLIMCATGTAQQQMSLMAAVYLNMGRTPDQMREFHGRHDVSGDAMRALPGIMELLERDRPKYVAAVGGLLSYLEARWDEDKAELLVRCRDQGIELAEADQDHC